MLTKFCESKGWNCSTVDFSEGTSGGFKEIQFEVSGDDVYGTLKYEAGVHRVQRVPQTETQGRVHTSAATVMVFPEAEEFDVYPLRTIDNIGPAGAIISTAGDMARWIRFHLGNGVIDGERVLSKEQHDELWATHFEITPGAGYGLGWMLHEDDGVVEHGGNVRGGSERPGGLPAGNEGTALPFCAPHGPLFKIRPRLLPVGTGAATKLSLD